MKESLKKCLIILGALVIIALAACAFNSKIGFYAVCGILAILGYAYRYLKDGKDAQNEIEQLRAERASAENAANSLRIQLKTEREAAELNLAKEKAKAKQTKKPVNGKSQG